MRRSVFLAPFLGWIVVIAGCAGGQMTQVSTPRGLQVSAATATLRAEESLQITAASSTGETASGVRWAVNGISGGNQVVGTMDASGRYTAPASLPPDHHVTISAERGADRAEMVLTLWNPVPQVASVTSREMSGSAATGNIELIIAGRKFVPGARVNVSGTVYAGVVESATQVKAVVPAAALAGSVALSVGNPAPGAAFSETIYLALTRPSRPSRGGASNPAARFLTQASFGATAADINAIQALRTSLGTMTQALNQYIDDQMDPAVTVPSQWPDFSSQVEPVVPVNANGTPLCNNFMHCAQILWFQNALQKPDQLRQRTAFALSQIWVISGNTVRQSDSYLTYYRILNNRTFGNYYQIMDEVTRSSAMGYYLDMGNSPMAAPGSIANENYARELLQLFTVGLYLLNEDGTFQLDGAGQRIPVYTEQHVQEFARALTGWTYPRNSGTVVFGQNFNLVGSGTTATNRMVPMMPVEAQHDTGAKTLLSYPGAVSPTLPAGNFAQQDLDGALQNVFNHPNLPPFISLQLIQHLVTSNPSPAYVQRVVDVFKNNGSGVRGDMAAVIKAILMDEEARRDDLYPTPNKQGHLREPVLLVTGILRNIGFSTAGAVPFANSRGTTNNVGAGLPRLGAFMGQNVLLAPSVFNYFTPDYSIQGGTLLGPEFQLQTTANAPMRANFADSASRNQFTTSAIDVSGSLAALANLATNPAQLVDQLDQQFTHGQMSAPMRQTIIDRVTALPGVTATDRTFRARMVLYLVTTSSQYQVIR